MIETTGGNGDIDGGRPLLYDLANGAETVGVATRARALDAMLVGLVR
jgi:hypothetical protein